ncbi:DUF3089 domain-containing protein [Alteraurantiacibacter buctensis]|uniref:DUF3089 domain-containing protein n=1 Tax=Alteraurantiacibacter buctensis TaxID=1503981 RepID=A0A844YZZ1_9SPHN|nr:DUF3089 domain-containing protein [Alteraurantiacibacter buctensis]MXO71273.1 DUF3089 domain-containing protein [Alteraurantiacibacter buctensis]
MRKFLYFIVFGILLALGVLLALRLYGEELTRLAMVPSAEFTGPQALAHNAYADPAMWISRPGMGAGNDPALWEPQVREGFTAPPQPPVTPPFAVFFVHPTSFYSRAAWNAPLDDADSRRIAETFVAGMASPFNRAAEIWAPRYRQATFGSFLAEEPAAGQSLDAAYADVALAFDYFVATVAQDRPIVLAGHSQGAAHVLRLLREKVAGTPLQGRLAAVYPVGWPISVEHDLPRLPLPACAAPDQPACLVSWASFAKEAEPGMMLEQYRASPGLDGVLRGDSPILCVNPLTGSANGQADMAANLGTLVPNAELTSGDLVPGAVPAVCDRQGLLLIGDPPEMGSYVLPGNNYHVYDIPLFWANLRADVARRVNAWQAARP